MYPMMPTSNLDCPKIDALIQKQKQDANELSILGLRGISKSHEKNIDDLKTLGSMMDCDL